MPVPFQPLLSSSPFSIQWGWPWQDPPKTHITPVFREWHSLLVSAWVVAGTPPLTTQRNITQFYPWKPCLATNYGHSDSTSSITGVLTRITLTDFRKFSLGVTTLHTQCSPINIVFPHFLFLHVPTFAWPFFFLVPPIHSLPEKSAQFLLPRDIHAFLPRPLLFTQPLWDYRL